MAGRRKSPIQLLRAPPRAGALLAPEPALTVCRERREPLSTIAMPISTASATAPTRAVRLPTHAL